MASITVADLRQAEAEEGRKEPISNPRVCYERTEVHCVGCTSLPVSEGTEGNSLRFAKRIALANELERDKESTWDLTSQNARVVAK